MTISTLEAFDRLANFLLATAALTIAALVVHAIGGRRRGRLEPLGLVFGLVFLAAGVRAAVRVWAPWPIDPPAATALLLVDGLTAMAACAFLLLHRRYGLFIESAGVVRAYESEVAEKEREARALAQVNEELRRLDTLKSEFLAMVSHELRTPLTAIIGYSRLLLRQVHGPLTAKQTEQQEAIYRGAQRLSDLINDLLDVSRLETGRVELHPRPTSIRSSVDQVTAIVGVAAQAKEIRIDNNVPADLPPVQADPSRLQQILVNLIGNAVKFSRRGDTVRVASGRHRDYVWVSVEDDGMGIARDQLARIWDPFYQVEGPMQRRHGGSGLGLAIVRRLVELHGGVVRAESDGEDRGSRFTFTMPVAQPAPLVEAPAPETAAAEPERVLVGWDVLIVEDEAQTRELMRTVIEDVLGGTARLVEDGERALGDAAGRTPGLILLDLMLPGLSGWEVARRLRQHPRTAGTPIIAVSALARSQEREAAQRAGCDAYLPKPFTPEELARLVTVTVESQAVVR